MATRYAVASGNWSNPATWDGGTLPVAGDDVYANGKIVTIDAGLTTQNVALISNEPNGSIVAGGAFYLSSNSTLLADVIRAGTTHCVYLNGAGITCSVIAGSIYGSSAGGYAGVYINAASTLNIVAGAVHGGNFNSVPAAGISINSGTVTITGDVFGSPVNNQTAGVYITNATSVSILGTATGGPAGASGVHNSSALTVDVSVSKANDYPNSGCTAAALGTYQQNNSGAIRVDAMIFGSGGIPPVYGRHYIRDAGTNYVQMRQSNAGAVTVIGEVPNDYPLPADVRSGVSYDFGAKIGTCAVPPAGSVALGVPVGATTGTAALSPEALLGTALKTRLENCATVQTTGDQLAAFGA